VAETVEEAIRAEVAALAPDFVTMRHVLHQNPELSDREEGTAKLVAESLRAAGIDPSTRGEQLSVTDFARLAATDPVQP